MLLKVQPVIKNNFTNKGELPCKYADRSKPCGAILKDAVNDSLSLSILLFSRLSSIYPKLEMADLKGCEREGGSLRENAKMQFQIRWNGPQNATMSLPVKARVRYK